ncbi:MAG: hypothetical protein AAGL11_09670 [Pseudomonadota bacterium]
MNTDEKTVLSQQVDFLHQERLRRSKQQFEYVRLNLINVGILSLFGVLGVLSKDTGIASKLIEDATFLFALAGVFTIISATLFLFWIDDAITIAGMDRFLAMNEKRVDKSGDLYWYEYRDQLNKTTPFTFKKWAFNTAVFLAFICPPFLFVFFNLLFSMVEIPIMGWIVFIGACAVFLITPLWAWRKFSKRLYG